MCKPAVSFRVLVVLAAAGLVFAWAAPAYCQQNPAGVAIDAQGLLQMKSYADPTGQLTQQRFAAAKAALAKEVAVHSACRKVSLNALEKEIAAHQGAVTDTMRHLAGLLRVHYVFYYPDSHDIVLAGPAEGWAADLSGRVVGLTTHRPVLQLQDLVVALRAFAPGRPGTPFIGCSIDPTPEGLASLQRFLRSVGSYANPNDPQRTQFLQEGVQKSLGLQKISVSGVSPKTDVARILVEADYRMKLIGIGLEEPPVKMVTFIQRANLAQVHKNALFRWFFVPDYKCVRVAEDGMAMELVGDGVKLVGEDEVVGAGGARQGAAAPKGNPASQAFVVSFTKKYAQLAERSPVYAELRNVIDLAVAAAFIQQQGYYAKAGWSMPFFGDEKAFPVETCNAPQAVQAAVGAVWKGNTLGTPIGGGVAIHPQTALTSDNRLSDEDGKVNKARDEGKLHLAKGQWWWN